MKNPFLNYCRRKNCAELVYMGETIASEKQLCLKHFNVYIEKIYRQKVNPQNKRKTCKTCHAKITNKRNKTYCSNVCRQKGSRKIVDLSLSNLVKSHEWRRVERLIKSSPLGLNSINHENNFDELLALVSLCNFERSQKDKFFRFHHVIPLNFKGMNTLSNIIVVPDFIKHSDNLALVNSIEMNDKNPYYVKNSIIDSFLKNKNLALHFQTLIEIIEEKPEINESKLQEKQVIIERYINRIKNLFLIYRYLSKKYNPLFILGHLTAQSYVINQFHQFKSINSLIDTCSRLKDNKELPALIEFDFLNLIALTCHVSILNFSQIQNCFLDDTNNELIYLSKRKLLNEHSLHRTNSKLMNHITPYIKYNLQKDNINESKLSYDFIKKLYEKYYSKNR